MSGAGNGTVAALAGLVAEATAHAEAQATVVQQEELAYARWWLAVIELREWFCDVRNFPPKEAAAEWRRHAFERLDRLATLPPGEGIAEHWAYERASKTAEMWARQLRRGRDMSLIYEMRRFRYRCQFACGRLIARLDDEQPARPGPGRARRRGRGQQHGNAPAAPDSSDTPSA